MFMAFLGIWIRGSLCLYLLLVPFPLFPSGVLLYFILLLVLGFFWYISAFVLSIFCLIIHPLEACCFLTRGRKQVGLDGRGGGEEVGGVEREENIIRIYCIRKCLFSIKGENIKKKKNRLTVSSTTKCYRANST